MDITTNIENSARTAREMAEVQRESYEALTENFAAAQRRGVGLANDGLEFVKLQEDIVRASQEWLAGGLKLLQLQQRNAEFVGGWTGEVVEALNEQTEHNARTAEALARSMSKQRESFGAFARQWAWAYREFFSPFAYAQEGLRTAQRATRQGLEATERVTEQATRRGLKVAEEATGQTEEVLRRTEEATREAELRSAVFGALKTTDYEGLSVEEVSARIEGLPAEQLEKVREFEKRNKNRETLIERIERKIRTNS